MHRRIGEMAATRYQRAKALVRTVVAGSGLGSGAATSSAAAATSEPDSARFTYAAADVVRLRAYAAEQDWPELKTSADRIAERSKPRTRGSGEPRRAPPASMTASCS